MDGNLTVVNPQDGSIVEFGGGVSAVEMQRNLMEMKAKIDLIQQFTKEVMKEGLDYGEVPGTGKRSLFQPGADKLNALYGYARHIVAKDERKDLSTGEYEATVKVQLRHKATGVVVGEGEGSCSTMETKYRYRWVGEKDVPRGIDRDSLLSKQRDGKYGQYTSYRVENPDLFDVWNTVLKMAIKRAYVAATLAATGLSGIFQQDEEEFDAWVEGEEVVEVQKPKARQGSGQTSNRGSGNGSSNKLSPAQYGKILGDAKRKDIDENGIKAIVQYIKGKPLGDLTTAEASSVIEFIAKADPSELQELAQNSGGSDNPFGIDEEGLS